jgi:hypothetical protein
VLGAVPQQTADRVERVVAVPAPVQGLLLDTAADLVVRVLPHVSFSVRPDVWVGLGELSPFWP